MEDIDKILVKKAGPILCSIMDLYTATLLKS